MNHMSYDPKHPLLMVDDLFRALGYDSIPSIPLPHPPAEMWDALLKEVEYVVLCADNEGVGRNVVYQDFLPGGSEYGQ